jgi:hypothetical protein
MNDTNPMSAFGDFGKWVPGFEFLKGLTQPGSAQAASAMPSLGGWVAPTLNVEDLEQRIKELKTVLFWLEQNGTALKATIQAMEVQKMTLVTLKGMNVSMQEMAQAFSIPTPAPEAASKPAPFSAPFSSPSPDVASSPVPGFADLGQPRASSKPTAPPTAQFADSSEPPEAPAQAAPAGVDPMQWWGALTQQFQTIANAAIKDAAARTPEMPAMKASAEQATDLFSQAIKSSTEAWSEAVKPSRPAPGQRQAAPARKAPAKKAASAKKAAQKSAPKAASKAAPKTKSAAASAAKRAR